MYRTKLVIFSLSALALFATAAGTIAASPNKAPWRIALSSDREGDSECYSMNTDGTNVRRLTRTPGVDGCGMFSPDGRKLLYYRNQGGVWVMNADGSAKRNLTPNTGYNSPGSWSPDGRKIVFTSNRDGNNELYVMNADGSGQQNLAPSPSSDEHAGGWSGDGRTILFTTNRDGNWELYAMDADGGNPRNLTRHPLSDGRDGGFAWSPDSHKIVFATNRDRNRTRAGGKVSSELWMMNADGSGQRRLTRTPEFEYAFGWSPDGRTIAFGRFPSTPRWAFFLMNADGSDVRKVTWSLPGKR